MTESDPLFARYGRDCAAGEVLFREGDVGDVMYVIREGVVRISKAGSDGQKRLADLGAGEFFGEMSILNDKPRNATAEVLEPAKLLVINARTFEQMVKSNAEVALRLIKKLALRLDSANELIEVLLHRDPKARVILGLARQVERAGEEREGGAIFVPMEREELATEVGVSLAESSEVLQRLCRLQIAEESVDELGRLGFLVHDARRLREFLEFLEMREKFGDA
ncbi:MAG: Crp/Fnr family transcriptional regulator [Deltaproteobacteria bacterium]|jgi:CRP/FNR family cyclic AMP-dependent transcriptional regulator